MLGHWVVLAFKLGIQLIDLRFQHLHFGGAEIAFVGEGRQYQLQQKRENEDDDAIAPFGHAQQIEHRDDHILVHPAEYAPAQWNH